MELGRVRLRRDFAIRQHNNGFSAAPCEWPNDIGRSCVKRCKWETKPIGTISSACIYKGTYSNTCTWYFSKYIELAYGKKG